MLEPRLQPLATEIMMLAILSATIRLNIRAEYLA